MALRFRLLSKLGRARLRRAKQFAEKLALGTSVAEALTEKEDLIAALKALRHPKPSFSALCKARIVSNAWRGPSTRWSLRLYGKGNCINRAGSR